MKGIRRSILRGWASLVAGGFVLGFLCHEVRAAEWFIEPAMTIRGEVNSNLTLTTFSHDPTYGHWVSPGARFGGATAADRAFEASGYLRSIRALGEAARKAATTTGEGSLLREMIAARMGEEARR